MASTVYPLKLAGPLTLINPTVWIKRSWPLASTLVAGLYCDRIMWSANGIGRAELRYQHGYLKRNLEWFNRPPLDLARVWVYITGTDALARTWHWRGLVTGDASTRKGRQSVQDSGDQAIIVDELSWCFTRAVIDRSTINGDVHGWAMPLNLDPVRNTPRPNKKIGELTFTTRDDDAEWWTPKAICDLLLGPYLWDSSDHPPITNGVGVEHTWRPRIELQGKTVAQVLQELADPRRGMTWYLEHSGAGSTLKFATHTNTAITLPNGATIPANPRDMTILHDDATTVPAAVYHRDTSQRYDQVQVVGDPIGSVFTLNTRRDMDPDWTIDQQDAYEEAYRAVNPAGYVALNREQKIESNDRLRNSPPLDRVFSAFRVDPLLLALPSGSGSQPIFPLVNPSNGGPTSVAAPVVWDLARLSTELPLRADLSYVAFPSAPTAIGTVNPTPELVEAIAAIKIGDRFWPLQRLGAAARAQSAGPNGIKWSLDVRPYIHGSGLRVGASEPAHVLAKEDIPDPTTMAHTDVLPQASWQDLWVTVFSQCQTPAIAAWPPVATITNGQTAIKRIEVGDRFRMTFMPQDTVLGVSADGQLVKAQNSGWVESGWTEALALARMAFELYEIERQNVQFDVSFVDTGLRLGDIVTAIGFGDPPIPVNTLISAIEIDFTNNTTRISTSGAEELDFRAFL